MTGKTKRAEISNTPIIGIEIAIVRAARMMKILLMKVAGIPLTLAPSSSNDKYTNSLKKIKTRIEMIIPSKKIMKTSVGRTVRILPNK